MSNPDSNSKLFEATRIGAIEVANRIVMAPLTRCRAGPGEAVTELQAEYYAQRAAAGLIISEATQVCDEGRGYFGAPGIYTPEQEAGWRLVTDAVHAAGGKIVAQLWHVGPISHPLIQVDGAIPVSASNVNPGGFFHDATGGKHERVDPRPMTVAEIHATVAKFAAAAEVAKRAGFDGVEVHAANNYLLENFIRDSSNKRTDEFGGSVANRIRFPLAVVDAVLAVWGPGRVGIRLSPVSDASGALPDSNPQAVYGALIDELSSRGLAYLHLVEGQTGSTRTLDGFDFGGARSRFGGFTIFNNGYTKAMAIEAIESGHTDAVAFGRPFISNPDLVKRFARDLPLADVNWSTVYGPGPVGYTDYPTAAASE